MAEHVDGISIHHNSSIQIYSDLRSYLRCTGYRQVTDRLHYGYVFVSRLFPAPARPCGSSNTSRWVLVSVWASKLRFFAWAFVRAILTTGLFTILQNHGKSCVKQCNIMQKQESFAFFLSLDRDDRVFTWVFTDLLQAMESVPAAATWFWCGILRNHRIEQIGHRFSLAFCCP